MQRIETDEGPVFSLSEEDILTACTAWVASQDCVVASERDPRLIITYQKTAYVLIPTYDLEDSEREKGK